VLELALRFGMDNDDVMRDFPKMLLRSLNVWILNSVCGDLDEELQGNWIKGEKFLDKGTGFSNKTLFCFLLKGTSVKTYYEFFCRGLPSSIKISMALYLHIWIQEG